MIQPERMETIITNLIDMQVYTEKDSDVVWLRSMIAEYKNLRYRAERAENLIRELYSHAKIVDVGYE